MMKSLATKAMLAAGTATVAMGTLSAPAEAFSVFTNRTDWQNAVNSLTSPAANPIITEDFESEPGGSVSSPYTTQEGVEITFPAFASIDTASPKSLLAAFGQGTFVTFEVPTPSLAVGLDLQNNGNLPGNGYTWTVSSGQTGVIPIPNTPSFLGFVTHPGDALLTSLSITTDQSATVAGFDNVSFATPVPTPALLPGLIGMGAAALRKRKQEAEA
jgi:hypothetical protein